MLRLCNESHFSASFRRFQHGDFVEVLDVAAGRSADGGACDFSPALLSCCAIPRWLRLRRWDRRKFAFRSDDGLLGSYRISPVFRFVAREWPRLLFSIIVDCENSERRHFRSLREMGSMFFGIGGGFSTSKIVR